MSITYYASGSMLNDTFGDIAFSAPANYYLGLSTTTISNSGSNVTEPIGATGYARVTVPNNKTYFSYASEGVILNSTDLEFPTSGSSWGTITDVFLADTSGSGTGNVWVFEALSSAKIIQDATTVTFSASAVTFSMTN